MQSANTRGLAVLPLARDDLREENARMPIPDFQTLMLPLLKDIASANERPNADAEAALAEEFKLTAAERAQLLPSGQQRTFGNRIAWAKAHLKQAGLVEAPRRAVYRVTQRGKDVLAKNPPRIDVKFLDQFPGHKEFHTAAKPNVTPPPPGGEMTPAEHMAFGYQQLKEELSEELIRRVKECPPDFFEQLVVELLLAMGYGGSREDAGTAVGKAGDGGIDGIIKEDRLGLDTIYIQAKRWEGTVSRPEIQKFAGALQGQRARKGIFITTSSFTKDAREFAAAIESKIILIDGEQLAGFMIDHDIGVTKVAAYVVKRVDSDYFSQE